MNYNSACSAWVTNPSLTSGQTQTEGAEQNTWIYTVQQESYETETKASTMSTVPCQTARGE